MALDADDFADGVDAKTAGLDAPSFALTVQVKDQPARKLVLGGKEGDDTYAKLDGGDRVWKLRKADVDRIVKAPAQWRDKQLAKIDAKDIDQIDVVKGTDKLTLERTGDATWKSAEAADLDSGKANQIAMAFTPGIKGSEIAETTDVKTTQLDKPYAVVTVTRHDKSTLKLTFGAEKDGAYFTQSTDRPADVIMLPEFSVKRLVKVAADLKKSAGGPPMPGGPPG
jgi:hypothetical protein